MAKDKRSDDDYEVGYGKPPKASQFQKGQSGNPKGRPRGARGFRATVEREMERKVTIRENGCQATLSKREVAAKQLVAKAAAGDMPAVKLLAQLDTEKAATIELQADASQEHSEPDQTDKDILEHYLRTRRDNAVEPEASKKPSDSEDGEDEK